MSTFKDKEIFIELTKDGILLNHTLTVPFAQTNLPYQFFKLKEKQLFWKVEQLGYNAASGTLEVEVVNYSETNYLGLYMQDPKYPVNRIRFGKLDWKRFEPLLYTYTFSGLSKMVYNSGSNAFEGLPSPLANRSNSFQRTELPQFQPRAEEQRTARPTAISRKLSIPFDLARFRDGFVAFDISIAAEPCEVQLMNPFIRKEFDLIKGWFCRKFGKETFEVDVSGTLNNNRLEGLSCHSEEISSINDGLIRSFRIYAVEDFLDEGQHGKAVKAFTPDQVLTPKGSRKPPFSPVDINAKELLAAIISLRKVRNEQELEFLSSHDRVSIEELRITPDPSFGFIFRFSLSGRTCFVWELLDSNATYIWAFSNGTMDEPETLQCMELQISIVYDAGRETYLRSRDIKENKDFTFTRIFHTLPKDDAAAGFAKWSEQVGRLLK